MDSLAITLVLISATMHAVRDFFTKQAHDKQVFVWLYEIASLLFFLPIALYIGITQGIGNPVGVYIGLGAGIIHFLYWFCLSKSYEQGDLSHVYPIMRSSPALVLIVSVFFLREQVTLVGTAGILLVVAGSYLINMKTITLTELVAPFRSVAREHATMFAVLTMVTVAAYSLTDKVGVTYLHPILYAYVLTVVALALFTPYVLKVKTWSIIRHEWEQNKRAILLNGTLVIVGYTLILFAFTIAKLSYIVGLRQISIVIAVLLGGHLLQEKHKTIRFTAASIIFIGAFLISIAK